MPTIGELHHTPQQLQEPRAVSFNRSKSLYVRRRRDSGLPGAAEPAPGRTGRIEKKRLVVVPIANGIPKLLGPSSFFIVQSNC